MIIGFVGFHSSGKSRLCQDLVARFKWQWVQKRELLKEWSGTVDNEPAWTEWYRNLYRTIGSYEVMHHLLKRVKYNRNSDNVVLFDAIHTPDEWRAVKEVDPHGLLVGVFVPIETRLDRSIPEDLTLDLNRRRHWHAAGEDECLLSQIEWSFCGTAPPEFRTFEINELANYLTKSGKIKAL